MQLVCAVQHTEPRFSDEGLRPGRRAAAAKTGKAGDENKSAM
jgi:hypothetical protein